MLREILKKQKDKSVQLNYGRELVVAMARDYGRNHPGALNVLDIGFGSGTDLLNVREALAGREVRLSGIDAFAEHVAQASAQGITAYRLNIETENWPLPDQTFDIVIANQIVEHTKEIFWIFSEISRVLKPGGIAIVGVPNLAALHCRLLLLSGEQPSCIELLGPHVRGFTRNAFRRFITSGHYFSLDQTSGANFYPFPPAIARFLSGWLPAFAVCLFFKIRRLEQPGRFINILDSGFFETEYFRGTD